MPTPLLYVTKQGGIGVIQPFTAAQSELVNPSFALRFLFAIIMHAHLALPFTHVVVCVESCQPCKLKVDLAAGVS